MNIYNPEIKYIDKTHQYFKDSKELVSVTTKLKEFQEYFDEQYWAKVKSPDLKLSQLQVLRLWHQQRVGGNMLGSLIHDYLESGLVGRYFDQSISEIIYLPAYNKCISHCNKFIDWYNDNNYQVIANELVVGNDHIAGQIDNLSYKEDYIIFDYKTDKEIEFVNDYGKRMKPPFTFLDDTNWNKYKLQVNTYRELLKQTKGIEVKKMFIIWINPDNNSFMKFQIPIIEEVKEIII